MEVPGDQDPSEATSRRGDFSPFSPRGGLRRSLRQAAVTAHRLLDEENVEVQEGERGVRPRKRETVLRPWVQGSLRGRGPPREKKRNRGPLFLWRTGGLAT
ncbi:UNVERIFIED_CONTAM: hypothetical protein Slati_3920800 [Sesamum latifolium]|uniref:Uncharacterized protein n=1 Tax=Sesamum latifolium TaxID=2727402 RepID=A0AAW2TNS1_9LAMI